MDSRIAPIVGLKNTHATAIIVVEIVAPTTIANSNAARPTTDDSREPTRGIHVRSTIIGANRR